MLIVFKAWTLNIMFKNHDIMCSKGLDKYDKDSESILMFSAQSKLTSILWSRNYEHDCWNKKIFNISHLFTYRR